MMDGEFVPPVPSLETPTILVPIRYPLTAESTQTLAHAVTLADEYGGSELVVLHVNLHHMSGRAKSAELSRAITPIVGETPTTVCISEGFLVEEIILEEVLRLDADIVVLGETKTPKWRRALNGLIGNDPDIALFLQEQTDVQIELCE